MQSFVQIALAWLGLERYVAMWLLFFSRDIQITQLHIQMLHSTPCIQPLDGELDTESIAETKKAIPPV
ncbi:hypothetical protein ACJMK2_020913 [Sinanodonta woodiana]|uniref:Uncharacterized protein n=1 Tax=Sinanodonta woodiana TaxID=1069815 RepID=A0ABD3U1Q1_SINWO